MLFELMHIPVNCSRILTELSYMLLNRCFHLLGLTMVQVKMM